MTSEPTKRNDAAIELIGIIDQFSSKLISIKECASLHIDHAETFRTVFMSHARSIIQQTQDKTLSLRLAESRELSRTLKNPHTTIISQSLLIYGFSTFDAYVGNLLKALYKIVPSLIHKLDEKELTVSQLVQHENVEDVLESIIDRDISNLLRGSYSKLFAKLEKRHEFSTLTKFENWKVFVEGSQRRNLITHCDGVVSEQYLNECKKVNYEVPEGVSVGTNLEVDASYLENALDVIYEVGIKLGHTLCRKACSSEKEEFESHLSANLFELLIREEFRLASKLGKFAVEFPNPRSELSNRIACINYAQALKWSGDESTALEVLNSRDWSSSIREFRLGVSVLKGDFEGACKLMLEIGKNGELLNKDSYYDWPIFREFRNSKEFSDSFKSVFGIEFVPKDGPKILTIKHQYESLLAKSKEERHASEMANKNAKKRRIRKKK